MTQQFHEFVRVGEAAKILGTTPEWARLLAKRGRLEYVDSPSFGRMYVKADVERLAREREQRRAA